MADLNLALRVRADLNNAQRNLQRLERELDDTGKAANRAGTGMDRMGRGVGRLRTLLATLGGGLLVRQIVRSADAVTNLRSQLRLVTDSQEELNEVFDATYALAQDTRQELGSTVNLYARLARSTDQLELSNQDLLTVTRAINQSFIVSGAGAQEAAAATLQLSQGMASGTLRGEELNSVLENSPRLARAIADGLGVTIGELRALGEQGRLTTEVVTQALLRTADTIDAEFQRMPRTVGQALQQLRNDLLVTFGEADTGPLVEGIDELRDIVTDPEFQRSVITLANGFLKLVGQAGELVEALEFLSQWSGLASPDETNLRDLRQLESSILDALNSGPLSRIKFFGPGGVVEYYDEAELRQELADVQSRIQRAMDVQNISRTIDNPIANATGALGQQLNADRNSRPIQLGDGGDSESEAEKAAKDREKFVAQLEREADLFEATAEATRRYEIEQMKLSGTLLERANAADEALRKQEALKQQAEDDAEIASLQVRLLRAQGNEAAAAEAELEQRYGALLERLETRGDESGARTVRNLMDLELLRSRLSEAEAAIDDTLGRMAREEQSIEVQRSTGAISEVEARERLLELHRETANVLEEQRPLLEELAQQPGQVGEAARAALQMVDNQVKELRSSTSELQRTLEQGLESGLSSAIKGLADGTMNLRDAISQLGQSVANALADMAAKGLAENITGSLFGGGIGALFAASGGQVRGPGTGTSDSIPAMLSDKEYVTRAAVTTQPGALDFLQDFNKRGMAALDDWNPARHNTGGLAGVPAPEMGAPSLGKASLDEPSKAFSAQVANNINLNYIDDPDRIASYMRGRAGEEAITVMISRNPQKFRQLLKV
ncbi:MULTISPECIES: tape measure protein [unclassified Marinimicrobium]|uniref:tape measure protein n=3 Tax=Marinimicrobium TaxID=359337 RepID=UPI00257D1F7F|nr:MULTISPECIES: tape measure protein [unclassified Marinimicrobium]